MYTTGAAARHGYDGQENVQQIDRADEPFDLRAARQRPRQLKRTARRVRAAQHRVRREPLWRVGLRWRGDDELEARRWSAVQTHNELAHIAVYTGGVLCSEAVGGQSDATTRCVIVGHRGQDGEARRYANRSDRRIRPQRWLAHVLGIGRYLTHLLAGLAGDTTIDPVVITPRPNAVPAGIRTKRVSRVGGWRFGPREHDLRLPFELRRMGGDVLHSPAENPPRRPGMPWIQTLLDVTPLLIEHPSTAIETQRWRRLGPRLRDAAAIIAISEATAQGGVRALGLERSRIHVVHLGVDAQFRPVSGETPADPPYLVNVAAFGPHKGHADAFAVVAACWPMQARHTV